jgi:hypothetical protein
VVTTVGIMTTEITNSGQLRRYIRSSVTRAIVEEVARRPRGYERLLRHRVRDPDRLRRARKIAEGLGMLRSMRW